MFMVCGVHGGGGGGLYSYYDQEPGGNQIQIMQ